MMNPSKTALVFGGHSPIAIEISKTLASSYKVIHVSRAIDNFLSDKFTSIENVSLLQCNIDASDEIVTFLIDFIRGGVDLVVFTQRFRGEIDSLDNEFNIQVKFPILLIQEMQGKGTLRDKSLIIFLSSPAASYIVDDQSISYHISKAAVNQIVRYFANRLAPRTRVLGISPGGFVLKERNQEYFTRNERKTQIIRDFLPLGDLLTTQSIAEVVQLITSPQANSLNGQIFSLDGGYLNIEPSQLINRLIKDE